MRKLAAVVLPILLLTVALSGLLLFRRAGAETLVLLGSGEVRLSENGGASLQLSTTTEGPSLTLYRDFRERVGEENFRRMLGEGMLEEYEALTGMRAVPSLFSVEERGEEGLRISTEASISRASRFNPSENLWEVRIGLKKGGGRDGRSFILGQMMFAQLMLRSMPERGQRMERVTVLPLKLPEGAVLVNGEELSGRKWRVDFGGGNYRETRLELEDSELKLTERVVVTEQPPEALTPDLFRSLRDYRCFTVKYALPGAEGAPQSEEEGGEEGTDFCWSEGTSFSFDFTLPFALTGEVSAEAYIGGSVGLGLSWVMEWNFGGEGLQMFRTYAKLDSSLSLDLDWNLQGGPSYDWSRKLYEHHCPVYTVLFGFPVWVDLEAGVSGGLEVAAEKFFLKARVTSSTTFRLGVQWTRDGGWGPLAEIEPSFTREGPYMGGLVRAQPYLDFRLGAYFYSLVGPHLSFKPLLELRAENLENWSLEAGFDVDGGVDMQSLSDWLGIGDWSTTLYRWRTPLATGSGEGIPPSGPNTPPHLSRRTGPPPRVGVNSLLVYEAYYWDEEGDPPKYVRCILDNRPVQMRCVGGDFRTGALYRYEWTTTPSDVGPHTYYFEASDWRETVRWPETGVVSSPTVSEEVSLPPSWVCRIPGVITEVRAAEEGSHFAVVADLGSEGRSLYFFSTEENRPLWVKDNIGSAAISSEGSYILASGLPHSNPRLFLLDSSGRELWSQDVGGYPCPVDLSRGGETAAAIGMSGGEHALYLLSREGVPLWTRRLGPPGGSVPLLTLSRDGRYAAVFLQNENRRTIFLFSRDSPSPLWTHELVEPDTVFSLELSGDGTYLAAGCHSGIRLFSRLENAPLWSYRTAGPVRDVGLPWGALLAAGDAYEIAAERRFEGKIYLFRTERETPEWVYTAGPIACLSLGGGGLAAGDMEGRLRFFDQRGNLLWEYTASSFVYPASIGVFSDGRVVAGDVAGGVYFFGP